MLSAETRQRLAAAQAQLVNGLMGQGPALPGFHPDRVRASAESLARKRQRAVARAWPALTRALAEAFAGRFATYAETTPLPREGGPLADGRAFARFLAAAKELPDAGKLEALAV